MCFVSFWLDGSIRSMGVWPLEVGPRRTSDANESSGSDTFASETGVVLFTTVLSETIKRKKNA